MVHRKRLVDSLEFRKARSYCFVRSKFDPKMQERIFLGTPEEVTNFVHIAIGDKVVSTEIPELPQGLVLTDNRCRGAFQILV